MKNLWIGGCVLALAGGVMVGRVSSAPEVPTSTAADCASASGDVRGSAVGSDAPRGVSTANRPRMPALPRAALQVMTPWETLVSEQPEATQHFQQAMQDRMSDMQWARAFHDCTQTLGPAPSKVRFTADVRNADGSLSIASWRAQVLDGPDVPPDTLDCVQLGLPTGALPLTERWPGAAPSFEYDLEMTLER